MTIAIPTRTQRPETGDKMIRISADTWKRLRNIRVQMTSETDELVNSYDVVIAALIEEHPKYGERR